MKKGESLVRIRIVTEMSSAQGAASSRSNKPVDLGLKRGLLVLTAKGSPHSTKITDTGWGPLAQTGGRRFHNGWRLESFRLDGTDPTDDELASFGVAAFADLLPSPHPEFARGRVARIPQAAKTTM